MKKTNLKQEKPRTLKKKLSAALAMLLIATLLMTTTTFAWFVLSTAPEVTGIETKVGANGIKVIIGCTKSKVIKEHLIKRIIIILTCMN